LPGPSHVPGGGCADHNSHTDRDGRDPAWSLRGGRPRLRFRLLGRWRDFLRLRFWLGFRFRFRLRFWFWLRFRFWFRFRFRSGRRRLFPGGFCLLSDSRIFRFGRQLGLRGRLFLFGLLLRFVRRAFLRIRCVPAGLV
jgi:hypothetical protein